MHTNTGGQQLGVSVQEGSMGREIAQRKGGGRARGLQMDTQWKNVAMTV